MSFLFKLLIVCFLSMEVWTVKGSDSSGEDIIKMVSSFGYPIRTYYVETEDGYILTVFRIPYGRNSSKIKVQPVLLTHGLLGSSENFVFLGPKKSLAYILADAGYDVWLINCRGTRHSKKHKTLNPEQKEFWDFSWHEIGIYDLPAVIDHILNVTKKENLFYIGHSQGGTVAFVMVSEKPEYIKTIKLMIGLAPGAFFKSEKNPIIQFAAANYKLIQSVAEYLHIYQFPPVFFSDSSIRALLKAVCVDSTILKNTCRRIFMLLTNETPVLFDINTIPSAMSIFPASCSTKQAYHYAQLIISGNFQKYDHGPEQNMKKYGTRNPPSYHLKKHQVSHCNLHWKRRQSRV